MVHRGRASDGRWRHRVTVATAGVTLVLMGWGAFVTSIEAGLAVPDWPSSYDSWDPLNPWPGWWRITPLLAEHGHRLLGMLTGLLTTVLAVWTWFAEPRRFVRRLAVGAFVLVCLQGLLGGLRVICLSLDLAVVHAATAQLFLGLIVALALFTSAAWREADGTAATRRRDAATATAVPRDAGLAGLALAALGALYVQIVLGALLRHPGAGLDPLLAGLHIAGGVAVTAFVWAFFFRVRQGFRGQPVLPVAARLLAALVVVQLVLGFTAYLATLDDAGRLEPGTLQVVVNTAHAVVGAFLMAGAVLAALGAYRWGRPAAVGGI